MVSANKLLKSLYPNIQPPPLVHAASIGTEVLRYYCRVIWEVIWIVLDTDPLT
jgi:hypothetical protein